MIRDEKDLDQFLKNVEDLDQKRQVQQQRKPAGHAKGPPTNKKPYHLSINDNEKSLKVAKGILDGTYKETESYKAIIDDNVDQDSALEIDCISETSVTLSPQKLNSPVRYRNEIETGSPISKKYSSSQNTYNDNDEKRRTKSTNERFLVSEEDYALLQKLKMQKDDKSREVEEKVYFPSRGKPRDQRSHLDDREESGRYNMDHKRNNHNYHRSQGDLRGHRFQKKHNQISDDEEELPPSLPARRYKTEDAEIENQDTLPALNNKQQRNLLINKAHEPRFKDKNMSEIPNDSSSKNLEKVDGYKAPAIDRSTKPNIVSRNSEMESESKRSDSNKTKDNVKPPVPAPRPSIKQKSFIDSLETNKLTHATSNESATSSKSLQKSSHIDYLDSVQKRGPPVPEKKRSTTKSFPIQKTEGSDGFIGSVIKSNDSEISQQLKPVIQPKPGFLNEFDIENNEKSKNKSKPEVPKKKLALKIAGETLKTKDQKPIVPDKNIGLQFSKESLKPTTKKPEVSKKSQEILLQKLNPVVKQKPSIPPKKADIKLPDLKFVQNNKNKDEEEVLEINKIHLRKSTVNISNTTSSVKNEDEKVLPEALLKHKTLQKAKTAPAIPQRKISMPEALVKAKAMRESITVNLSKPLAPQKELTPKEKLEAILQAPNPHLRSISRSSTNSEISSNSSNLTRRNTDSILSSNVYSSSSSTTSLSHPNKARAKGPKRKLPKALA